MGLVGPPLLKSMLGLEQCWIMIELSVRIKLSVDQAMKEEVANSQTYDRTEKWIRRGQTTITILITSFLLATLIVLNVKINNKTGNERD